VSRKKVDYQLMMITLSKLSDVQISFTIVKRKKCKQNRYNIQYLPQPRCVAGTICGNL